MSATANQTELVAGAPSDARDVREDLGHYAVVGTRWGEALSAGRNLVKALGSRPLLVARAEARLAIELMRIARGRSGLQPAADDYRFREREWRKHPVFKRLLQGYLAWSNTLLDGVHQLPLTPEQRCRLLFAADHIVAAAAPSNLFLTHPGFYKRAVRTRGYSVVAGLRHVAQDLWHRRGIPRQVNASAFRLGENIAATEGAVVYRDPVFELIQYSPRTATVDTKPVLICPPQVNKYYVLDLSPRKSFVRYALESGQQVFAISWRNPTAAQSDWGLATYLDATERALDSVRAITGERPVKLLGACAGGLTAAMTLARMAMRGEQDKIACLTLLVTVLDAPLLDRSDGGNGKTVVNAALAPSSASGVLNGADMAHAFAWLRPDDMMWYFVVNNYVLGKRPPASDALYWNSDTTRLPARLHADLLSLYRDHGPHDFHVGGQPVDLTAINRDVFMVAGERDHIVPWQVCYRSVQMFRSNVRFVLGAGGHVHSIVCPPDDERGRFYINDDYSADPQTWRAAARQRPGSWWPAWIRWCEAHGGERQPAPAVYGNSDHEPIEAAPGRYVRQT